MFRRVRVGLSFRGLGMETRRTFLKRGIMTGACLAVPGYAVAGEKGWGSKGYRTTDPRKALVLWYSRTGHTGRYGRLPGAVRTWTAV